MFSKEEITAFANIINRPGLKIDVTEAQAFAFLKKRVADELMKLENKEKENVGKEEKAAKQASKAVNAPVINEKSKK